MKINNIVLCAVLLTTLSAQSVLAANKAVSFMDELDKNMAVTTNYVWRGIAQTAGAAAVQGGAAYNMKNGFGMDLWLSSSAAGGSDEFDLTASYALQQDRTGYEFGLISYSYPQLAAASFQEVFAGVNANQMNAYVYIDTDSNRGSNIYLEFSITLADIKLVLGVNSNDVPTSDYNYISAALPLSKEMMLSFSQTDINGDKQELALSYSFPMK
ncbi:MAG: TorF family putative porin [Gammaproteobacteria bacterium]|nr:TorF family putative porin [Gammaproteobacteria bacterium]